MNRTISIFLLFVVFKAYSQSDDLELIPWSPDYKLTWKDFKGQNADSINGMAGTCSQIEVIPYHYNDSLIYWVTNNFNPYLSFVDSIIFELYDDGSPDLLDHEQIHFDIAEIHTRLIRKKLHELHLTDSLTTNRYSYEVKKLLTAKSEMNRHYDSETAHSMIKSKQQEWNEKVTEQLSELDSYYRSNSKKNTPHNNSEQQ